MPNRLSDLRYSRGRGGGLEDVTLCFIIKIVSFVPLVQHAIDGAAAVPSLGILISALTLGETAGPSLIAGVLSVGAGIRLARTASNPQAQVVSSGKPG